MNDASKTVLEWFRRTCPPGAHFNATRGFYYPGPGRSLAELMERQEQVAREIKGDRMIAADRLAQFTKRVEAESRRRRALRAREAAVQRHDAPHTPGGQLLHAGLL